MIGFTKQVDDDMSFTQVCRIRLTLCSILHFKNVIKRVEDILNIFMHLNPIWQNFLFCQNPTSDKIRQASSLIAFGKTLVSSFWTESNYYSMSESFGKTSAILMQVKTKNFSFGINFSNYTKSYLLSKLEALPRRQPRFSKLDLQEFKSFTQL